MAFASGRPWGRSVSTTALFVVGCLLTGSTGRAFGQGYVLGSFDGAAIYDRFGWSVGGVGDVDGDGFDDVLVGAPGFMFAGVTTAPGYAKVFSGGTGAELLAFNGSAGANDGLGFSVAGAGDLNADGVPDLLVGAPGADFGGFTDAGQVRAFSGAGGTLLFSVGGSAPSARMGRTVARLGDVNGDGVPDFVAAGGNSLVRIFSGAGGSVLATVNVQNFPSSLAGAGDVNGDGLPDFIVGIEIAELAQVFAGGSSSLLFSFGGLASGDLFGSSVAGPGDVNGDGVPDLVVGARQGLAPGGYARAFSGVNGAPLFTVNGSGIAAQFGYSVAGVGDLNGDGFAEVAVGSPGAGGSPVRVYSGPSGGLLFSLSGPPSLGRSVAGAGDGNADGIPDLVVGADGAAPAGLTYQGQAQVFSVVGIATGSALFGTGCPGTSGFVPRMSTFGGPPTIGNPSFGLAISRGPGGAIAILFLGTAPDIAGSPLGGCLQHLAGLIFPVAAVTLGGPPGVGGAGYRLVGVPVPADPSLAGQVVYFHWAILDPASPNGLFTTSDAISVTVL